MTFPYLICFISFDINLLVAARNFASTNFRKSDFSVSFWISSDISLKLRSKYRLSVKLFAQNFAKLHAKFRSKILENKEQNSLNFICITFAQYCKCRFGSRNKCSSLPFTWSVMLVIFEILFEGYISHMAVYERSLHKSLVQTQGT